MNNDIILEIRNITKRYPGVVALNDVSFSIRRGEVHALCGENGAGKSTLIKILFGAALADQGEVWIDGQQTHITSPDEGLRAGISVVHQELKLAEYLSIGENIFLGHLPRKKILGCGFVQWRALYERAEKLFERMGVDYDVHTPVEDLSVAQKQIVEIAKALSHDAKILIMDEPSATLTEKELDTLFGIIALLKSQGVTIIYISHRLEEIFRIADRVTVLRDGCYIGTNAVAETDRDQLIAMMVGRKLGNAYLKQSRVSDAVKLEVSHLNTDVLRDVSFCAHQGEVLGLAGLIGAGRTEVARAIFGADKLLSGSIKIDGKPAMIKNVRDAVSHRIALIPEERKSQGVILPMTIRENVTLADLPSYRDGLFINKRREGEATCRQVEMLRIKAPDAEVSVSSLSGGNQQKVVLAKWLDTDSDIILFDEPTRGIDVGAKQEIYHIINTLVAGGKTVIMISSDMPELIGMCDRILVMHEGRIKGELTRDEFSQEKILDLALT